MTDPGYLNGLDAWPLPEVRSKRDAVNEIETGLSYMRRVVQTRLDIVAAEKRHRETGTHLDVSDPDGELKDILAENVHAPGLGRLSTLMAPGLLDEELERQMEDVLPSAKVGAVTEIADAELARAADGLADFERTVSAQRKAVFNVLDRLQEEIVRRYRDGGASVDELLS